MPLPARGLQQPRSANPLFPAVFQAPAAGHRVHEAPEQSGQHCPGDRQGRHANAGGEGLLQTAGKGLLPLPRAPSPGAPSPAGPVPLVSPSCPPGQGCAGRAWPGAQRIPPAAAIPHGRRIQACSPSTSSCFSWISVSAGEVWSSTSPGLPLLPPLLLLLLFFSGWFLLFWEVDGAACRGWEILVQEPGKNVWVC